MSITSFEEYVSSLSRLSVHIDPTVVTPQMEEIKGAALGLRELDTVSVETLADWVRQHQSAAFVLALAVGLSREKLQNQLHHWFGTGNWGLVAREHSLDFISRMDADFDLLRLLTAQRNRTYDFGDILVARAGTRVTAASAGRSGRRIEDEIEAVATELGLPFMLRTRFEGRNGRTAPADLAIPTSGRTCTIAVAAKGFDSTGSKLTDAVREIEEMADARTGGQIVLAVVDGIGWRRRIADLKRIWELRATNQIDGLYSLATLDQFRKDLRDFSRYRHVTPIDGRLLD